MNHTQKIYQFLSQIFDYYNFSLFESKLSSCVISIGAKNASGVFYRNKWKTQEGKIIHEIAINPESNFHAVDFHQAIVHEMCHLWQFEHGMYQSTEGYHNVEFANKMQSIGLDVSSTGMAGGQRTGFQMSDFIIEDGPFEKAFKKFQESDEKEFMNICNLESFQDVRPKYNRLKAKYSCNCGTNIWGKPNLTGLFCKKCNSDFVIKK
ncbi:SprT-like domain-containing protein [Soonwooa purpurea]